MGFARTLRRPSGNVTGLSGSALVPLAGQAVLIASFPEQSLPKKIIEIANRLIATSGSAEDGALMSYGLEHKDPMRRLAVILDKVLRGANPAEIPFELPDRFVFQLNRATACAIGASIPPDMLLRVTEIVG